MEHLAPVFEKCVIVGPDGVVRNGWEMRVAVGDSPLVVKGTNKKSLEKTYTRIFKEPPPSLHWRNTRLRSFF